MKLVRGVIEVLGSFGLACALLLNLFLLTLFGTLYQVEGGLFEAQKRYFESWYVVQSTPVPLILPGGVTCMGLLAINLFLGGFVRIRKSAATVGVIVVHVGIALMLAAGFVKQFHSEDGHLTLAEGQSSDEFTSYFLWEVAVWDASQTANVEEYLIPNEHIVDLHGNGKRTFSNPALPFDLELSGFLRNCDALPKGPMWQADSPVVDGYALKALDDELEAEQNRAGLTLTFRDRASGATRTDLLWLFEQHPATFEAGGKTWAASLRHVRYSMPFAVRLEDVRKEDYPGISTVRSYESDITQVEGGAEKRVRIQMNEPLRAGGLALFQSGYQAFRGTEVSTFSVVRNPSDHWPLYSCIVIGCGLLLIFLPRLYRFVRAQNKKHAAAAVT
ncbi:MAG: hypothetical protein EXS08_12495 [Planctomycetes bacterium]|nr:hypothetical protein [Planctomycetota bacterium]